MLRDNNTAEREIATSAPSKSGFTGVVAVRRGSRVPPYWQKALRLFFAVAFCVGVGVSTLFAVGADSPYYKQIKIATAGAGITCAVSQSALIGRMATAGLENTLGTLIGGWTGFGVFALGNYLLNEYPEYPIPYEWLFRAACAPFVAMLGALYGWFLGMEISGRIVLLTFLLVVINNDEMEIALYATIARICAIITGVVASEISHAIIFPKSATSEALELMGKALHSLAGFNGLVGHALLGFTADTAEGEHVTVLVDDGLIDMEAEKYHAAIHPALNTVQENLLVARKECYLGSCGSCWCIAPGCAGCARWKLPEALVIDASTSIRRVTRHQHGLMSLFQLGFKDSVEAALKEQFPAELMTRTFSHLNAALQDIAAAFPHYAVVKSANLHKFKSDVKALMSVTAVERDMINSMWKFKRQRELSIRAWSMKTMSVDGISVDAMSNAMSGDLDVMSYPVTPGSPSSLDGVAEEPDAAKDIIKFPDTPEGRLGQVRWFSFQFMMEQLADQVEELYSDISDLLMKIPGTHMP